MIKTWHHSKCGGTIHIIVEVEVKTDELRNKEPIGEEPTIATCDKCGRCFKASQLQWD